MKTSLRAVLYTRVSTDEQAETGTSMAGQLEALQHVARTLKAEVVAVIEEPGLSGGLFTARPGIQRALHLIESGAANVLMAYNISRLSRDREHQSIIKRRVEAVGARLVFCDMTFEQSPEGDLAYGVLGNFAHYERLLIRQRTMNGRKRRAKEGVQPMRSRCPYGYHVVNSTDVLKGLYSAEAAGTYVIREDQAVWVRAIFERLASGVSLRKTCAWLNEQAVPTPRGAKQWDPKTIHTIVKNPVHKGIAYFGRIETLHDERLITERGRATDETWRIRPEEEWISFPAPPLVTEAVWNAVQQRLSSNRERLSGNPRRKFLLSSLVCCPVCGCKMAGANKKSRRVRSADVVLQYYQCHPLRNGCPDKYFPATRVERQVLDALVQTARRPELVAHALRAYQANQVQQPGADQRALHATLQAELEQLDRREAKTAEAQVDALVSGRSAGIYDQLLREIDKRKASLKRQIAELDRLLNSVEPEAVVSTADKVERVLQSVELVLNADDVLTLAERQAILASVIDRVVPEPDGVRIQLRTETVYTVWSMSGCIGLSAAADSASVTIPR